MKILDQFDGYKADCAKYLEMDRSNFCRILKRHGLFGYKQKHNGKPKKDDL